MFYVCTIRFSILYSFCTSRNIPNTFSELSLWILNILCLHLTSSEEIWGVEACLKLYDFKKNCNCSWLIDDRNRHVHLCSIKVITLHIFSKQNVLYNVFYWDLKNVFPRPFKNVPECHVFGKREGSIHLRKVNENYFANFHVLSINTY